MSGGVAGWGAEGVGPRGWAGRGCEVGPRPDPRTADDVVQVLLGAHSLSKPEPSKQLRDVQRAVRHPGSGPDRIAHDIALLKVRRLGPSYPLGSTQGLASPLPSAPPPQCPSAAPFCDFTLLSLLADPECLVGPLCATPALARRRPRAGPRNALRRGRLGCGQPRGAQARRPAEADSAHHGPEHLQSAGAS